VTRRSTGLAYSPLRPREYVNRHPLARAGERCHDDAVGEKALLPGERVWFYDVRSPERRMAVHSHPRDGVVVISLWRGDRCTSSFRLPLAEGARLISVLADGMAQGIPGSSTQPRTTKQSAPNHLWVVPDSDERQETSSADPPGVST
jgi:hypothetical protein